MALGEIIRQQRESLGLTQEQLATTIGISKPYLSNIETGKAKNPPTDRILKGLEAALGVRGGELIRIAHLARTPLDVRHEHELLEVECQKLRNILKRLLEQTPRKEDGRLDLDAMPAAVPPGTSQEGLSPNLTIPVVNRVGAGYPLCFPDLDYPATVADDYVRCLDVHDPHAFAVRVPDETMEPLYCQGDVVVFSPALPAASGQDCFVRFADGGATTFRRYYEDSDGVIRLQPINSEHPPRYCRRDEITGLWPALVCQHRLQRQRRSRVTTRSSPLGRPS